MNNITDSGFMPAPLQELTDPIQLQGYNIQKLEDLAQACRDKIIDVTSRNGGHLASSLGAVELTLALAKVFDLKENKVIFDVGHQAYTYKLITDRKEKLEGLGKQVGIAKFLRRQESPYDHFGAGHASTSISAALGIAVGERLQGTNITKDPNTKRKTIAIIGDGSMTGGLAFEGLNHAGHLDEDNLIVILNDNEMSIDPVVGALSKTIINISSSRSFNMLRSEISKQSKEKRLPKIIKNGFKRLNDSFMAFFTQGVWFEQLNFRYFGQIDGHNLKDIISLLEHTKDLKGPILLHVSTQKGKGFLPAEGDSLNYHGVGAFDPDSGEKIKAITKGRSYTDIWSKCFREIITKDEQVVAISAAMLGNTGLAGLEKDFPKRIFDVGIAEGHAVTFAGGLATEGIKPFVVIYSTFLQRAIDHIAHDIALQNLPVRFILDRSGFVGPDGATHHGVLDLTYLRMIPNMTILAPKNGKELQAMLHFMHNYEEGPIALRFPRGNCEEIDQEKIDQEDAQIPLIEKGKAELIQSGTDAIILAVGSMVNPAKRMIASLASAGYNVGLINARFVKPLDEPLILQELEKCKGIITLEENALTGGFGSGVLEMLSAHGIYKPSLALGIPDAFFEHATREEQLQAAGIDEKTAKERILAFLTNTQ